MNFSETNRMITFLILILFSLITSIINQSSPFIHTPQEVQLASQIVSEPTVNHPPKNNNYTSYLIFIVITSVDAFKKRNLHRDIFLQGMEFEVNNNVYHDYFFVIGLPKNGNSDNATDSDNDASISRLLNQELKSSTDIIQGNFIDSEGNNTLKVITALSWLRATAQYYNWLNLDRYVVIIEDEASINILGIHRMIHDFPYYPTSNIICKVSYGAMVERDINSPEFVPESIYPSSTYPPFCSEGVIIMTFDLVAELASSIVTNHIGPVVRDFGLFVTAIAAHQTPAVITNSDWFVHKFSNCSDTDWSHLIATSGCESDPDQQIYKPSKHTLKSIQESLDLIAFFQGYHSKKITSLISNVIRIQEKRSQKAIEHREKADIPNQLPPTFEVIKTSVINNPQWVHFLWLTVIIMVLFLLFLEKRENHRLVRQHIA